MSHSPGSTLIPSVEMTSAPAGTADRLDPVAVDQHDAVVERPAAIAVDQPSAHQSFQGTGESRGRESEEREGGGGRPAEHGAWLGHGDRFSSGEYVKYQIGWPA